MPHVLLKEYERQLTRKRKERMGQLEALLAGPPEEVEARTVKGLVPSVDGRPARGGVVLELRKLRLMDFQTVLRNAVRGGGGGSVGQRSVGSELRNTFGEAPSLPCFLQILPPPYPLT